MKKVLTIAGSDSGGGAGVQADLKTITVLNCFGTSAVTALTVQNTLGVTGVYPVPPGFVYEQIRAVVTDIGADAAKTGMLFSAEIIEAVAKAVRDFDVPNLVVDPVMVAKGGARLLQEDAVEALKSHLLPCARLITPNAPEAEVLCGLQIKSVDDQIEAARGIHEQTRADVLVKGGHLEGDEIHDVLWTGGEVTVLEARRVPSKNTHGTGCSLSAAIACGLADGMDIRAAVGRAQRFVAAGIRMAENIGAGHGPLNFVQAARAVYARCQERSRT